ncbi:MAG: hypothetical protein MUC79_10860 [Thiobacillaceae bacterium]|jgi:hypothetical protein|nr:hypothetical protein [Thiobacillaceae bacterium]
MTRVRLALVLCCLPLALAAPPVLAEQEGVLMRAGRLLDRVLSNAPPASTDTARVEAPRRIAVLPASGRGTPEQLEDVRIAIHNGLSAKNFDLKRPHETDRDLIVAGIPPESLTLEDPERLARLLHLEGLVYVDVLAISKVYAGAYAHQEVSVRLRLYSAAERAIIWEKVESQVEREGGISLSLLGILTTVVTSTRVLTDGVRQALVDRLARSFASAIPEPDAGQGGVKPPAIQVAFSNWGDGPFRPGDEVILYMKGEPGLAVNFDLGRDRTGMPMQEKAAGEYLGSYVVREGDHAENLLVTLRATRLSPRASLDWRVPGRIRLDNQPPAGVLELSAQPVREGVHLTWRHEDGAEETTSFTIERADSESGQFAKLASVATSEYLDKSPAMGRAYHYRITPQDTAGNRGPPSRLRVVTVAPGPTLLGGELGEETVLHALGSPYRVQGRLRVPPHASLVLEPGSVLEFGDGASLDVQGSILARGTPEAPVSFQGSHWRLRVSDTGKRMQHWRHTRFEGAQGSVEIQAANARFEGCIWRGMRNALVAGDSADLAIQRGLFVQNQTGLRLGNSKASLEGVEFRGNEVGLVSGQGVELVAAGLLFDDNRMHVEAARNLNLGAAGFRDASYPELLSRLRGPVSIDWRALPEDQNLLSKWSRLQWRDLLAALRAGELNKADAIMQGLAPTLDAEGRSLGAAIALLAGREPGDDALADASFVRAARAVAKDRSGGGWIWIQDAHLPYEPALEDAPGQLLEEAAARFARALVSQRYPSAPAEALKRLASLDLARHQHGRLLLPGERDGAYWRYRVAYLIDRPALERDLRLAGVIERDKSALLIGLLNHGERTEALHKLADAMHRQKIRFIDLGQGGFTARAQEKAREAGVHLVLETRYVVEVGQTRLSSNLKRFDARLTLNLYDVGDALVLQRYTATGSATDFRESTGMDLALGQALSRIETDLLAGIWRLDESRLARAKALP